MQSLPSERDPDDVYRINQVQTPDGEHLYTVDHFGKRKYMERFNLYRFDLLPQWMQDAIATLDTAGTGIGVPGLGRKIGSSYWIGDGLDEELFKIA